MSIASPKRVQAWRERHKGHEVTRAESSPPESIGPHVGAAPKNPPKPKVSITLLCHDCHVEIVIDQADYNPDDWRR